MPENRKGKNRKEKKKKREKNNFLSRRSELARCGLAPDVSEKRGLSISRGTIGVANHRLVGRVAYQSTSRLYWTALYWTALLYITLPY